MATSVKKKKSKVDSLYRDSDTRREHELRRKDVFDGLKGHNAEFRRDYARLIHAPAFRRLQGKTQLFPGVESDFFRNRITHSIEVAQVAKGIALRINATGFFKEQPINTDLVELAALAHDLGHPPFGHNGEEALDRCMQDDGGFEGNAQTLRILARLEKREASAAAADRCGLNLTYRTLAAVLKYDREIPGLRSMRKEPEKIAKGYYATEADLVKRIKSAVFPECTANHTFRSIECDIMDIADDIAYSTFDLEDAFKAGFFNPLEILSHSTNDDLLQKVARKVGNVLDEPDVSAHEVREIIVESFGGFIDKIIKEGIDTSNPMQVIEKIVRIYSTSKQMAYDGYLRTAFSSELIKQFIGGVYVDKLHMCPAMTAIKVERNTRFKLETLKHLTFEALTMSPRLRLVEFRGRDIITSIFQALTGAGGHMLLPDDWRDRYFVLSSDPERKRLVCDFMAGMTDRYAVEFFSRLNSAGNHLSIFKPF
ncbi:dGTP triphosphohydrolase [Paraburkholderia fungorum]|uniref:dGTP triphosphohydrolase n=1 Tax=Paraburkholderia fungorum TaxID=134537 RepID=UPI0038BC5398